MKKSNPASIQHKQNGRDANPRNRRQRDGSCSCPDRAAATKPSPSPTRKCKSSTVKKLCPTVGKPSARHPSSQIPSTSPTLVSPKSIKTKTTSTDGSQTAVLGIETEQSSANASQTAVRRCVCSETTLCRPSKSLEEVKPKIRQWLKENLKELTVNAACRYTNITQAKEWLENIKIKQKASGYAYRICTEVFADKSVRRFPCFLNVSRATFKLLRGYLKGLCREGNQCCEIYIKEDNVVVRVSYPRGRNCKYNFDEDKVERDKESLRTVDNGYIINPAVHREFGKVHGELWYGVEYWDIICRASSFDRDACSFPRYFVREVLKIRTNCKLNRQKLLELGQILGKAREELVGFAESAEKLEQFINSHQEALQLSPFDIFPDLLAIMSISHGMARVKVKEDEKHTTCLNFWKDRYVLSGRQTKGKFEGVALDTITGKVWNADMTYDHELCPAAGWKCCLSRITGRRWKEYVEPGKFSLVAFDDDRRFTPPASLLMRCVEGIPARGSILLSPI